MTAACTTGTLVRLPKLSVKPETVTSLFTIFAFLPTTGESAWLFRSVLDCAVASDEIIEVD